MTSRAYRKYKSAAQRLPPGYCNTISPTPSKQIDLIGILDPDPQFRRLL